MFNHTPFEKTNYSLVRIDYAYSYLGLAEKLEPIDL
jgi:hypothetical protein